MDVEDAVGPRPAQLGDEAAEGAAPLGRLDEAAVAHRVGVAVRRHRHRHLASAQRRPAPTDRLPLSTENHNNLPPSRISHFVPLIWLSIARVWPSLRIRTNLDGYVNDHQSCCLFCVCVCVCVCVKRRLLEVFEGPLGEGRPLAQAVADDDGPVGRHVVAVELDLVSRRAIQNRHLATQV